MAEDESMASIAVAVQQPYRDKGLLREHVLQALLHQLVGAANELKRVDVVELLRHLQDGEAIEGLSQALLLNPLAWG